MSTPVGPKNTKEKIIFLLPEGESVVPPDKDRGIMDAISLAKHVEELADRAYQQVFLTILPFFKGMEEAVKIVGEEVLLDPQYQVRDSYAKSLDNVKEFCPDNDPTNTLQLEYLVEARQPFVDSLCPRVSRKACIAEVVFAIRYAESLEEMEAVFQTAMYNDKNIFFGSLNKNPLLPFPNSKVKGYDIVPGTFVKYQGFAAEKCKEAFQARMLELKGEEQKKEEKASEKEAYVPQQVNLPVSPEDLFFGPVDEMSEKTTTLEWKHGAIPCTIKLRRVGPRLYVQAANGGERIGQVYGEFSQLGDESYVFLPQLLAKENLNCLCPTKEGERDRYLFNGMVDLSRFPMSQIIRSAAGLVMPHRLLPKDKQKAEQFAALQKPIRWRLSKPDGEVMTTKEFYEDVMLGSFDLVVPAGFSYVHRNGVNHSRPMKTRAEGKVRLFRLQDKQSGVTSISLEHASSREIAQILSTTGCQVKWDETDKATGIVPVTGEYPEDRGWKKAPDALKQMLNGGFYRFKEPNGAVANQAPPAAVSQTQTAAETVVETMAPALVET